MKVGRELERGPLLPHSRLPRRESTARQNLLERLCARGRAQLQAFEAHRGPPAQRARLKREFRVLVSREFRKKTVDVCVWKKRATRARASEPVFFMSPNRTIDVCPQDAPHACKESLYSGRIYIYREREREREREIFPDRDSIRFDSIRFDSLSVWFKPTLTLLPPGTRGHVEKTLGFLDAVRKVETTAGCSKNGQPTRCCACR